jgi:tetratricopeptide (TPR) repeat protein
MKIMNKRARIKTEVKDLIRNKDYSRAERLLDSSENIIEDDFDMKQLYGLCKLGLNKLDEAHQYLKEAKKIRSDSPEIYNNLGKLFDRQQKYSKAVNQYKKAIQLKSDYFEAYFNLGNTLRKIKKYRLALNSYKIAININPNVPEVYLHIGITLEKQKKLAEAIAIFQQLIDKFPGFMEGYNKLGLIYKKTDQFNKAELILKRGINKNDKYVRLYGNLANTLQREGKYSEALTYYNKAIQMEPDYHEAIFSRSLLYLLLGKFETGWQDYEHRWKLHGISKRKFKVPEWNGQNIEDKTLLLWAEQGLGDTIQFIRYVPKIKERVDRLIIECQPSLRSLFKSISGIDQIVDGTNNTPVKYDYHLPMLSLPRVFKTREETIPQKIPYLSPDQRARKKIEEKLAIDKKLFNIGIVWSGNPQHGNDHRRTCELFRFKTLKKIEKVQLFSLQKGEAASNLKYNNINWVTGLAPLIDDFSDTAAIIQKLDLVITVDTSVAHLAGALGKRVWILLPYYPDWRWMLERKDSPWYPTARLFRQNEPGNWNDVFIDLKKELKSLIKNNQEY